MKISTKLKKNSSNRWLSIAMVKIYGSRTWTRLSSAGKCPRKESNASYTNTILQVKYLTRLILLSTLHTVLLKNWKNMVWLAVLSKNIRISCNRFIITDFSWRFVNLLTKSKTMTKMSSPLLWSKSSSERIDWLVSPMKLCGCTLRCINLCSRTIFVRRKTMIGQVSPLKSSFIWSRKI